MLMKFLTVCLSVEGNHMSAMTISRSEIPGRTIVGLFVNEQTGHYVPLLVH